MEIRLREEKSTFKLDPNISRIAVRTRQSQGIDQQILTKKEAELREEQELYGWEKAWEERDVKRRMSLEKSKEFYLQAASIDPLGGGAPGLSYRIQQLFGNTRKIAAHGWLGPFTKYTLPSEREIFEKLSDADKARALAWESVGILAATAAPFIAKGGTKAVKGMSQWVKARRYGKQIPIEDAVTKIINEKGIWKGFNYQESITNRLKNEYRFASEEAEVISSVITGDNAVALRILDRTKTLKEKTFSKAWKKYISIPKTGIHRRPAIAESLIEKLSYTDMQARHFTELYKTNLKTIGHKVNFFHAENIMKEQTRRFYGEKIAENISFATMSETEIANILSSMLAPKGKKIIGSMHKLAMGEFRLPWVHAERDVYGAGEVVFKTKSKIFDRLVAAFTNSNKYTTEKVTIFMQMLSERGFGTLKEGKKGIRFIPNRKVYTPKNLDIAYDILKRIDNLAEAGRKGKTIGRDESLKMIDEIIDTAKARTPIAVELVIAVRDYHDVLYKDLLTGYIPKTIRRFGLSAKGESLVSNLERAWVSDINNVFRTQSSRNHSERVDLVKRMLKDYRTTLKDNPDAFLQVGKKLDEQMKELFGRLTYGSTKPGGIPAYLDHYMPRIGMRGTSFESKWRHALTGEPGYGKRRRLAQSQEVVPTLQEMIEARTRAQSKQMFMYDEISDVVDYAKTLPDDWQKHTDFTISRMLGRPSEWDHKIATFLQRVAPGIWDAHRAMKVAQKLTGLQYTGLIGLRPFSAIRNLTQPLIMTGAELGGGLGDNYSVLKGLKLAASGKHREYIRSIGGITEYIPDFSRGPLLPKTGLAGRWDSTRDAFMWMFRKSDRINRYWSGGAAVDKWERALGKTVGGAQNVAAFSRNLKLRVQQGWLRNDIESLLHLGRVEDAKAAYVNGIIANTQYLYTVLDAPAATGLGGAQKLVTSFSSWWMNYGSALSRWVSGGTTSDKVQRMGTWLVSSVVAEQFLEWYAGRKTALRSTLVGPFPFEGFGTPPAIQPMITGLKLLDETFTPETIIDNSQRSKIVRSFFGGLEQAATTFVPGGLATKKTIKGYQEDELMGALAAIFQKRLDEDFEPLFGLLE